MKKTLTLFFLIILIASNTFAQTPNWQWAKSAGGNYQDYVQSIATDAASRFTRLIDCCAFRQFCELRKLCAYGQFCGLIPLYYLTVVHLDSFVS